MDSLAIYDIWRLLQNPRTENEAEIRAHCRQAFLGDKTALCRVLGRYKMFVDTDDVGITSHLLLDGFWEMWVTEAMMRAVRRGSTVIDVGANLGYFTMLLADLTGPEGKVLAFEPNPALARRLNRSIAVNGFAPFTTLHQMALGSEEGFVELEVTADQPGGGHITGATGADGARRVSVGRLDAIPGALDVEFMKIDVEGYEQHVWHGMTGILEQKRPLTIFMEFTVSRYADPRGFLAEILSHGFSLGIIDYEKGVRPISADEIFAHSHMIDHMLAFSR